jgi:hypothetical protein
MDPADSETLRQQYVEVCKSYHAIHDFRAKLLALLPIASGAGGLTLLAHKDTVKAFLTPIGLFGAAVTFGLFIYEARGAQRCSALKHIAQTIEKRLHLDGNTGQFLSEPKPVLGFVREGVASAVVYLCIVTAWLYIAMQGRS